MICVGVLMVVVLVIINEFSDTLFWHRVALVLLLSGLALMAFSE